MFFGDQLGSFYRKRFKAIALQKDEFNQLILDLIRVKC